MVAAANWVTVRVQVAVDPLGMSMKQHSSARGISWTGFLVMIAGLSLMLNCLLLWKLYQPMIVQDIAAFKHPPPVNSGDPSRGPANAKVTVIEYADFQCPYCRQLHNELLDLQGQIPFRWVYREFPLAIHPQADQLAKASLCAAAQGKFWEFADAAFKEADHNSQSGFIDHLGQQLGLNRDKMRQCLASGETRVALQEAINRGNALDVFGTPTFFINGKRYVGVVPELQLKRLLRAAAS